MQYKQIFISPDKIPKIQSSTPLPTQDYSTKILTNKMHLNYLKSIVKKY